MYSVHFVWFIFFWGFLPQTFPKLLVYYFNSISIGINWAKYLQNKGLCSHFKLIHFQATKLNQFNLKTGHGG